MKKNSLLLLASIIISLLCLSKNTIAQVIEYDIVLLGGRVIDPETKLDAIKNVDIIQNRIAQISPEPLKGKQTINASGVGKV